MNRTSESIIIYISMKYEELQMYTKVENLSKLLVTK